MGTTANHKQVNYIRKEQELMRASQEEITRRIKELSKFVVESSPDSIDNTIPNDLHSTSFLNLSSIESHSLAVQISELQDEMNNLRQGFSSYKTKHLLQIMRDSWHERLSKVFHRWADTVYTHSETYYSDLVRLEQPLDIAEAIQIVMGETEALNRQSLLACGKLIKEKAVTSSAAISLIERILDNKYENDLKNIKERKIPYTIEEFLQEFFFRKFGMTNVAEKALSQLALAVKKTRNPYLILFARLTNLHPQPIPYAIALYITKIRVQFNKNASGKNKETNTLLEVIRLVFSLIQKNKEVRTLVLLRLVPTDWTLDKFLAMLVCYRLSILGMSSESMLVGRKSIKSDNAVEYIQTALDIFLTPELTDICGLMFEKGMNKSKLAKVFNMNAYFTDINTATVSKYDFLNAFVEVISELRVKALAKAIQVFGEQIEMQTLVKIVRTVDTSVASKIKREIRSDVVAKQEYCAFFMKYHLALPDMNDFCIPGLERTCISRQISQLDAVLGRKSTLKLSQVLK